MNVSTVSEMIKSGLARCNGRAIQQIRMGPKEWEKYYGDPTNVLGKSFLLVEGYGFVPVMVMAHSGVAIVTEVQQ